MAQKNKASGEKPLTGRVLSINDYPFYAEMVATMLTKKGGHTVQTEIAPVNLKAIERFNPDVIIINLVRKLETISAGGMIDFYHDVEGAKALRDLSRAAQEGKVKWPIILTSLAVLERELPHEPGLEYVAFVEVPQKMEVLLTIIRKILEAKAEDADIVAE